ncbi:MAG TPA: alkaline phosphatase family protein [Methylomirabilota bacterium]|jgi:predicted AlkP superfamily pyrophosphatase or phosphodiesterase
MAPAVVVVSVDGLGAALLADPTLHLPALRGLQARGVAAAGLRPVFPSVTWPCHSTLITGVPPMEHGVLGNHVLDRATGQIVSHYGDRTDRGIAAESVCERAVAAGLTAAAVCWPKTRGMSCLADNIPEFYEQELFERHASRRLWDELVDAGLPVHRYGEWSRHHPHGPLQDWLSMRTACHLVHRRPPDLLLLHFLVVDSFQHDFGVDSAEARWALQYVDGLLQRLLAALDEAGRLESTVVVVLGDHGFVPVERVALPNASLAADGLLRLDRRGVIVGHDVRVVANGGSAHVYVGRGASHQLLVDRMRERLAALPGVEAVLDAAECRERGLPDPAQDPTQGDLMLTAADGWHFGDHGTAELAAAAPIYRATHGHLPEDPRLLAGFVAAGPGVAEGARIGPLDALDVAPTVAAVLGVTLPRARRPPVGEMLDVVAARLA